ncbi:MAG: rod shape-determining protein RodA [Planctomycetota bacterium]
MSETIPVRLNWLLILPVFLLVLIGVLAIWSAGAPFTQRLISSSAETAGENIGSSPTAISVAAQIKNFLKIHVFKQLIFAVIGLVVFIFLLRINYYVIKDYSYLIYLFILGLLVLVIIIGRVTHGAQRWIPLGPFALQPSEFMKIAFVMALARFMMFKDNVKYMAYFIGPVLLTVIPMGLIFLQPNLGTTLIFLPTLIVMLFVAGARVKHILILIFTLLILFSSGYFFVLKEYQKDRIKAFVNPTRAPSSEGFQLIQSLVAVGSGGFIGRGWGSGESGATLFVPERHNDFVFTTISEEWGFLGSSFVLGLYLLFFLSALGSAYQTREPFGRLLISGLVTYLCVQTFINIGMTIGMAPITGIPLPFISYGGSSLLSSFIAAGLIVNVSLKQIPSFAQRDFE